jgi:hypothetical protein
MEAGSSLTSGTLRAKNSLVFDIPVCVVFRSTLNHQNLKKALPPNPASQQLITAISHSSLSGVEQHQKMA